MLRVDGADSSPVEGATVTVETADGTPDPRAVFLRTGTTSDSAGAFTLTDVPEGSYRLVARKEGYSPGETPLTIGAGAATEGLRLTLSSTTGLNLQVMGPTGPPSSVNLALLDSAGRIVLNGGYPVAEGGRARISEAPPGRWTLLVASGGSATVSLEVTVPGPAVQVALPTETALRVTVPALAGSAVLGKATLLGADGRPYRSL